MHCNDSHQEVGNEPEWSYVLKSAVLVVLLCTSFVGNTCLFVRNYRKSEKWRAADWLLQRKTLFGLLNGLFNIGFYLSSFLSGTWLLGHVGCQVYGVASSILLSGWIWLLTISLIERYKCVTKVSDHISMFSDVNTKIITYGALLLLFVLYLAPVYGWGEYSYLKGELDLELGIQNCTPLDGGLKDGHDAIDLVFAKKAFILLYKGNGSSDTFVMQRTKEYLSMDGDIAVRRHYFGPEGVVFSLRAYSQKALRCLWDSYTSEELQEGLVELMQHETSASMKIHSCDLRVYMKIKDFLEYQQFYMEYQEMSTCGLDLSPVNKNVWTFSLFMWTCTFVIPTVITSVVLFKLFRHNRRNTTALLSYKNTLSDDVWRTQVIIVATILSLGCYLPHITLQVMVSVSASISSNFIFVANALLFSVWSHLPLLELLAVKCDMFSNSSCFYYCWLCICCRACGRNRHYNGQHYDINSRTRLLSKRLSSNSASGYTSDTSVPKPMGVFGSGETCL